MNHVNHFRPGDLILTGKFPVISVIVSYDHVARKAISLELNCSAWSGNVGRGTIHDDRTVDWDGQFIIAFATEAIIGGSS